MPATKKLALAAAIMMAVFLFTGVAELAEARSRSGGRSFGGRPATSAPLRTAPSGQAMRPPGQGLFSSPFARGMAGGLMGGMIGGMLFGGTAQGAGMGGLGGSGIGLVEILLLFALGSFLYNRFFRRRGPSQNMGGVQEYLRGGPEGLIGGGGNPSEDRPDENLIEGVRQIWIVDAAFDPEGFKEIAQDLFFKIQAGWTRRDASGIKEFVGDSLLAEYADHFDQMKQQGQTNRLENIAVRRVDLVQAGVEQDEIFVTVRFTANLLDYTVDEAENVVSGDAFEPVKFQENWTFARPVGASGWKLEGIEKP